MDVLSVGQLATLTGGQLLLGNMPPLGGVCEPVRRIAHESEQAHPGEVVFHTVPHADRSCWLENAYNQGALGVIADRPLTPWDGRFALQIADPRSAVEKLAGWFRKHSAPLVALLITPAETASSASESEIHRQLQRFTTTLYGRKTHVGRPAKNKNTSPWLWPLIESYPRARAVLLTAQVNQIQSQEIVTCQPDVVVLAPEFVTQHAAQHTANGEFLSPQHDVIDLQPFRDLQRCLAPVNQETVIIAPETLMPRLLMNGRRVCSYAADSPQDASRLCGHAVGQIIGRTNTAAR